MTGAIIALKLITAVLQMIAKERHKDKIIKYLSNWENEWLSRTDIAIEVLGFKKHTLWRIFSADELNAIENEALEIRKKNAARPRQEAYKALQNQFEDSVPAIKEFLERTEGKVKDVTEHTGKVEIEGLLATISGATRGLPNVGQKKIEG